MKWTCWLKPGLHMKRWLGLLFFSVVLLSIGIGAVGAAILAHIPVIAALTIAMIGLLCLIVSLQRGILSLMRNLKELPPAKSGGTESDQLVRMVYDRQVRSRGRKIVVLGGGTGLSVLLRGMKQLTSNISAVVTVADDGGGSGKLREDLGMLPPGDIRNCLLALAEMEPTMEALMQYRFTEGTLKGQSFGNLFVASMNGISDSFEEAVKKMGDVLAVKGRVYPVTLEDLTLYAQLKNGRIIKGESKIPLKSLEEQSEIDFVFIRPRKPAALPEVLRAIEEAHAVVLGPGSLYTSVIPNLLVSEVAEKINRSSASVIYLTNLMTQPGETDGYSVSDHVHALMKNTKLRRLDYVLANKQEAPSQVVQKYEEEGAWMVSVEETDRTYLHSKGIRLLEVDAVDIQHQYIRHDAVTISTLIHDHLMEPPGKNNSTQKH